MRANLSVDVRGSIVRNLYKITQVMLKMVEGFMNKNILIH